MTEVLDVDPCFHALICHPRAQIRPPAPSVNMATYRAALDAPLRDISGEAVAEVRSFMIADVPVRLYRPEEKDGMAPVILFFHGGGFVAGSLDTHDMLCRALCRATGCAVLAVDYRLAPEHPHPAAIDDGVAVLRWLATDGRSHGIRVDRVGLCGDSAGGYLAVRVALAARDAALPLGLAHIGLFYPVVDPACATASMYDLADGFMLTRDAIRWFWSSFAGRPPEEATDLSLLAMDLSGLPSVSIVTAQFDPLKDEGAVLARRMSDAGIDVTLDCLAGMIHGFATLPHMTPIADSAVRHVGDAIVGRMEKMAE